MVKNRKIAFVFAAVCAFAFIAAMEIAFQSEDSVAGGDAPVLSLTVTPGGHVEYSINGSAPAKYTSKVTLQRGDDVVLTWKPDDGYEFDKCVGGGVNMSGGTGMTLINNNSDLILTVYFKPVDPLSVRFDYVPGVIWMWDHGEVEGIIWVASGETIKVNAVLQPGYAGTIVILVNGASYTANSAFTVSSSAVFTARGAALPPGVPDEYIVTFTGIGAVWSISGGHNEKITGNTVTLVSGTKIKVNAEPKEGYEGMPLIKAGTAAYKAGTEYEVNSNITFSVTGLQLKTYTLTFPKIDGVTWKYKGTTYDEFTATVSHGERISVEVIFEGDLTVMAGNEPYEPGTEIGVASNIVFAAVRQSDTANGDDTGGGGPIVMYAAVAAVIAIAGAAAAWFFFNRKP